jgi:hypothetical protein
MNTKHVGKHPSYRVDAVNEIVEKLAERVSRHLDDVTKTCLNCAHFSPKNELCMFNGTNQRPPAKVIVSGCPSHEDEIPF